MFAKIIINLRFHARLFLIVLIGITAQFHFTVSANQFDVLENSICKSSVNDDANTESLALCDYDNDLDLITSNQNYTDQTVDLTNTAKLQLEVFDMLVRKVATVVNNEIKLLGGYKLEFYARNLSSGMYDYRLVIGNKKLSKKRTLNN